MSASEQRPLQRLEMENATSAVLDIMVEIDPDRYLLKPGETMVIEADLRRGHFVINPYDGGMQIYPGNAIDFTVTINGVVAVPDWTTGMGIASDLS